MEPGQSEFVAILVKDSVLVFDRDLGEMLRSYGYYGKSILGYRQLSLIESAYLVGKGKLSVVGEAFDSLFSVGESMQSEFRIRYEVYANLRARGLVVKTGFKYGTHFRAYQSSPDDAHARYLIHAVTPDGMRMWRVQQFPAMLISPFTEGRTSTRGIRNASWPGTGPTFIIYDGEYHSTRPYVAFSNGVLLNLENTKNGSTITVYGGVFYGMDPDWGDTHVEGSYVPEGYASKEIEDGVYTVVKA